MVRKRDPNTVDLFRDYTPEPIVDRFADEEVKAYSLAGKLSKALARTMEDSGMTREQIASAMSDIVGEKISKGTLDTYASQAREQSQISAVRLVALVKITDDPRPLNALLEEAGLIVVPKKFEALLRRERAKELREKLDREFDAADAAWRASR